MGDLEIKRDKKRWEMRPDADKLFPAGIILAIVGNIVINTGMNCMKHAHNLIQNPEVSTQNLESTICINQTSSSGSLV